MTGFQIALAVTAGPMLLMLSIVSIGHLTGRLTVETPETHAWWCGIMISVAALTYVADREVESKVWHALDYGTITFSLVLAIKSLANVYLCRRIIARSEPELPTLPDETLSEWAFVRDGVLLQKVVIPDSWGTPVRINQVQPPFELYVNGELKRRVS